MEETLPGSEEDSRLLSSCLGKFFSRLKIAKEQSAFFTNNVIFNKKNSYSSVFTEQLSSTYYLTQRIFGKSSVEVTTKKSAFKAQLNYITQNELMIYLI